MWLADFPAVFFIFVTLIFFMKHCWKMMTSFMNSSIMFLTLLSFALFSSVSAHGGMPWPLIGQDGVGLPIKEQNSFHVNSKPVVRYPNSGAPIIFCKILTDQARPTLHCTGGIRAEWGYISDWLMLMVWGERHFQWMANVCKIYFRCTFWICTLYYPEMC